MTAPTRRVALVTQGFQTGGGVPTVARWLSAGLQATGEYTVDIHDLATSSRDGASRRLTSPRSWFRRSLCRPLANPATGRHWGANAVEIEPMRYRRRRELTRALGQYDIVQVVAGGPALANAVLGAAVPVVLQAATRVTWERESQLAATRGALRAWRELMTWIVDRDERRALRPLDAVLVWNESMLESVRPYCRGYVGLAAPGVDTERFRPHPGGWQRDGPLLSVCRLAEPRKGLDRLIRAHAALVTADPDVPDLVLAGRGRLEPGVARLIDELGLTSRVAVRSDVTDQQLPDLYRSASVFLQSSHEEGFGMSVLEAMASGLPVVSTETAGSRLTVVDGQTGWLVQQDGDAGALERDLAARIRQVLSADGPGMSDHARRRALSAFSEGVTLARFTDVYADLLDFPASGRRPRT